MNHSPRQTGVRTREAWWYDLLWSVLFVLATYGGYRYFVWYENAGESVVMWAPIAWVYQLTGKWGIVAAAALLSAVCLQSGIRKLMRLRRPAH